MKAPEIEAVELDVPVQARIRRVYVGAGVAFVPHPHVSGAWVRTHPCVVEVSCPQCHVPAGTLCVGSQKGFTVSHHCARQDAARTKRSRP